MNSFMYNRKKNESRKPGKNLNLRRLESMPRNIDLKCRSRIRSQVSFHPRGRARETLLACCYVGFMNTVCLIFIYLVLRTSTTSTNDEGVQIEWQWPLSGVHSIIMVILAQPGEGGGCTLHIYHHEQSCGQRWYFFSTLFSTCSLDIINCTLVL